MALSEEARKHARCTGPPSERTDGRRRAVVEARRGTPVIRIFLALVALSLGVATKAADPSPDAKQEIDHLLDHLGQSGCDFNRNGTWYGAAAARSHLQTKLEHLSRRGLVSTAEEFIDRAASVSRSGRDSGHRRGRDGSEVAVAESVRGATHRFLRRDCLDQVIVLDEVHLRRILGRYFKYDLADQATHATRSGTEFSARTGYTRLGSRSTSTDSFESVRLS